MWKNFDMTRTTDAFELEVPVGTACLIVKDYGSYKRFGRKPSEGGRLMSTSTYVFDDHGFFISEDDKTYINTYNDAGLITQREVFVNGKQKERHEYIYLDDEKGPGVVVKTYDEDGNIIRTSAWQTNNYYSEAPGGEVLYKLDTAGKKINGTIKVTNYRQEVNIRQSATYNDHGFLESSTLEAPGRSQVTTYSDYEYDDEGRWIKRYSSDQKLTRRQILSKEEYKKLKEQEQAEAERQRLEKLAKETEALKQRIAETGYAASSDLVATPIVNMEIPEIIAETGKPFVYVEAVIPDKASTVKWNEIVTVDVQVPAKLEFPNDSIGAVPSILRGKIYCEKEIDRQFPKPIKIKIDFNKNTNEWYIKDAEKLPARYHTITMEEVTALNKFIADYGKENRFRTKKLYLSKIIQHRVTFKPSNDSAVKSSFTKTFPIRFYLSDSNRK